MMPRSLANSDLCHWNKQVDRSIAVHLYMSMKIQPELASQSMLIVYKLS